ESFIRAGVGSPRRCRQVCNKEAAMAEIDVGVAGRPSIMARVALNMVAVALVTSGTAIGSSAAMAQPTPPGAAPRPGHLIKAPVGHRQPTAKDLPRNVQQSEGERTKKEREFDRKLDSICRGC